MKKINQCAFCAAGYIPSLAPGWGAFHTAWHAYTAYPARFRCINPQERAYEGLVNERLYDSAPGSDSGIPERDRV